MGDLEPTGSSSHAASPLPEGVLAAHSPNADGEWHLLSDHLRGTADRAGRFAEPFDSAAVGELVGRLHDVGKADPDWQAYLRRAAAGEQAERVPHKVAGAHLVNDLGRGLLAGVIEGHHGGLRWHTELHQTVLASGPTPGECAAIDQLRSSVAPARIDVRPPDWAISSRPDDPAAKLECELWLRMVFSALVDADYLDTEAHFHAMQAAARGLPGAVGIAALAERFYDRRAAEVQARRDDPVADARGEVFAAVVAQAGAPQGWFELTAPTGSGKTITALGFALEHARAHGLRRVVTAVPFVSVTEQVAAVYRRLLDEADSPAVVEHHSGMRPGTEDQEDQIGSGLWARLATENWDAPVVVTTTVQLLESLFQNRPSKVRKLHRLARSVIVIDEAQSIPWRLLEPTLAVVRSLVRHYGCSVVLCTATQPPFHRVAPPHDVERVELLRSGPRFPAQRVRAVVDVQPASHDAVVGRALSAAEEHCGQGLVVANTIADAASMARLARGITGMEYLSTRLCPAHRRDVLRRVITRLDAGEPCLVFSTQLVEAGIDVDFPFALRIVGPLPSIVQVAGRVNRHGRHEIGRLLVAELADGKLPPDEYKIGAKITLDLLRRNHDPLASDTLEIYYDRFLDQVRDKLDALDIQGSREHLNFPRVAKDYEMIADDTVGVLVPYSDFDAHKLQVPEHSGERRRLARILQPYVVSLRQKEFKNALKNEQVRSVADGWLYAWSGGYDQRFGLVSEGATEAMIW